MRYAMSVGYKGTLVLKKLLLCIDEWNGRRWGGQVNYFDMWFVILDPWL